MTAMLWLIAIILTVGGVGNLVMQLGSAGDGRTKIYGLLAGLGILAAFAALGSSPDVSATPQTKSAAVKSTTKTDGKADDPNAQSMLVILSRSAVKQKLRDPGSAEFSDVNYSYSGKVHVACGHVNSKNGFGGYAGRSRFVSAGIVDATYLETEVTDFEVLWSRMCRGL